ncbi:MAG: hypothetical protein EZS28_020921 [Streblomastix strix]|uniref:Uncharacterized protein n=1 Tax=Streblomastix strix TaxID=222440 RepID=A0A5J4VLU0_9EUKA|nr:MAG: hypothetical protein EZS28_020921 [Streblomastix strix]
MFSNPGMYYPFWEIRLSFEIIGLSKTQGDNVQLLNVKRVSTMCVWDWFFAKCRAHSGGIISDLLMIKSITCYAVSFFCSWSNSSVKPTILVNNVSTDAGCALSVKGMTAAFSVSSLVPSCLSALATCLP